MKNNRAPYLIKRRSRHGKTMWYVWRRPAPQIRLREDYGTKAFWAEYRAALYSDSAPRPKPASAGSLSELIADYKKSQAWLLLADDTRRTREGVFKRVERASGHLPATEVERSMIVEGREKTGSPGAAKHLITTLRGLFKWAVDVERVAEDPTENVTIPPAPKTEGHHTWTDEEIAAYKARWPLGTRQRLWMAVVLHTGLRRSDAVKLRWSLIKDGVITIATKKNGTPVIIPVEPELKEELDAGPVGKVFVIESLEGEPYTPASFSVVFGRARKAADVPGTAHGLRKAFTTRLAEAGATTSELNATLGWTGSKMSLLYTRKANRAELAKQALKKVRDKNGKNN